VIIITGYQQTPSKPNRPCHSAFCFYILAKIVLSQSAREALPNPTQFGIAENRAYLMLAVEFDLQPGNIRVSGQSKAATSGHFKSGHFQSVVSYYSSNNYYWRRDGERSENGKTTTHQTTACPGLVVPSDRERDRHPP
jgi:hypothetical protein